MPKTVTIPGGSEKDFLQDMRGRREEAVQGLEHVHDEAMDDLRMILNDKKTGQWDPQALEYRQKMVPPRPCITDNVMASFGERVKNEQRQSRPQVKVNPVDDKADPHTATVIEGLIRNIYYQSAADAVHDLAFDSMVDTSLGAWRILSEYSDPMSFNQELRIRPIGSAIVNNPLSIWWDLSCQNFVTSDKKFCGIDSVMRRKDAEKRFKRDTFPTSPDFAEGTSKAGWFLEDEVRFVEYLYVVEKPKKIVLLSNGKVMEKDDRLLQKVLRVIKGIRVVEERDTQMPEIQSCICSGNEVVEGPFFIPGRYIPIILTFGKILNEQGKLHIKSLHRDAKGGQELHNYLVSTALEQFSLQPSVPWLTTPKMTENFDHIWSRANEGGISNLPYNPDPDAAGMRPIRTEPPQINVQLFNWINQNLSIIRDVYGIQEAGLGMVSNETSGRAINARKSQSDMITSVFMSNHLLALQFEGLILAEQIPYYYDAPRTQMITGLEGDAIKVMLNQAFVTQTPQGPKQLMYDMKAGKYDVVVTVGPTASTQREETSRMLGDMIQAIAQTNPVGAQILTIEQMKMLNTPNHDRLIKMLKLTLPPAIKAAMEETDSGVPGAAGGSGEAQAAQLQAELERLTAQLQEMQAAIQELQSENARLAQEEESRIRKIEAEREWNAEKIALERERTREEYKLKREIAEKEAELKLKRITDEIDLLDRKATAELVQKDRHREASLPVKAEDVVARAEERA